MEAVNRVKFDDVDTMQERLSRMSVRGYNSDREPPLIMTTAQIRAFENQRERVQTHMKELEYAPNTSQYTMAAVGVSRLTTRSPRILLVMPPGLGKSRVIMAMIMLLGKPFTKVKVLYSHPSLHDAD